MGSLENPMNAVWNYYKNRGVEPRFWENDIHNNNNDNKFKNLFAERATFIGG